MANRLNDIEEAVRNPTAIVRHSGETAKFYKFIKNDRTYIMVAVKFSDTQNFIITAYPTKKIGRD